MARFARLFLLTLVLLLAGRAPVAWGCSCVGGLSDEEFAAPATLVFDGTARASEPAGETRGLRSVDWTWQVEDRSKGEPLGTVTIRTAGDEAGCGMTFTLGRRYRIFATEDDGVLHTGLCSGNRMLADVEPIASASPLAQEVPTNTPEPPAESARAGLPFLLAGVGILVAAALALPRVRPL